MEECGALSQRPAESWSGCECEQIGLYLADTALLYTRLRIYFRYFAPVCCANRLHFGAFSDACNIVWFVIGQLLVSDTIGRTASSA